MRILYLFFFICLTSISFSQPIRLQQLMVNRENTDTKYNEIYFDRNGMMWLGTSDGLYQYDGEEFLLFAINKKISDNNITAIYQDRDKIIWAGYKNGNIALLKDDSLQLFNPEEGLPAKSITSITQDKRGIMWFTTAGEGVYFLLDNRLYNINEDDGLSDNYTYKALEDNNGYVWIGTDQGITICNASIKNKIKEKLSYKTGLPDEIIRDLIKDDKGDIWIGTQAKGICNYNFKEKKIEIPPAMLNWNYGQVNSINISNNEWWIGTEDNGLINYNLRSNGLPVEYKIIETVKHNNISCVAKDKEGNVWATSNNGLIKTAGNALSFLHQAKNKKLNFIHAILCDHNNNLLFTPDQQLTRLTLSDKEENIKEYQITTPTRLIDIVSLYEDKCGYIWIGTMGEGLFRLNPETGFKQKITGLNTIEKANVLSIAAKDNELWIATLSGVVKGYLPADCNTDLLKVTFSSMESQKEIGNYFVYKVFVDSKKRVWIGTDGKGITCYDGTNFINYNKKNGLTSDVIYSITEDSKGNIWFSTLEGGIYKYDEKKFTNYTVLNGLSENTASSIIYDGNNHIVIVNHKGIDLLHTESGLVQNIMQESNTDKIQADLNAITKDNSGNIWIGTENGIIKLNSNFRSIFASAIPVIKKVMLLADRKFVKPNATLKYHQNNISIDFAGLWYTNPAQVNYQYKLEGYNKQWITTKDKRIIFSDLPPGNYQFKLRASAIKNFSNARETTFNFSISNPLWKEVWFRISAVVIITLLILYYLKIRERNIRRLQTLEKEKIKFQLDTLKSQVNPHFLFNSFNTLISIIDNDKNIAIEYVENLSEFFRNIVTYRDKDFITLDEEMKLSAAYYFLQQKRFGKNLTMNVNIEEEKRDMLVPPLVVQILIENAIKHNAVSKETTLTIDVFTNDHRLIVKNNINVKRSIEASTQTGLSNIINRYRLLTKNEIEITKTDNEFIVSLPLIENKT